MAIFNLYSKRQKALRGEIPDVYTYDALPRELKVQIIFIVEELYPDDVFNIWDTINKTWQ